MEPSSPGGVVCPPPVANIATNEPRAAGFEGEFTESSRFRIEPRPVPVKLWLKIPDAATVAVKGTGSELTPKYCTTTVAFVSPSTAKDAIAFICDADT
jgi:hypothetical protein